MVLTHAHTSSDHLSLARYLATVDNDVSPDKQQPYITLRRHHPYPSYLALHAVLTTGHINNASLLLPPWHWQLVYINVSFILLYSTII